MYTNVSEEFKEIVKSNSITAVAKIVFTNPNITIYGHATEELQSSLQDVQITDNCYNEGQLIGTAMTKEVEINIINKDNLDLADKEFELFVGVKLADGEYEYIPYGKYIITKYEDTKSNNIFKILAYDYMNNLNRLFTDLVKEKTFNPTFPLTLKRFKQELFNACNLQYEQQSLANDNFIINAMPSFEGMSIRAVVGKIAQLQGTFAKINRENKIQFYLKTATSEQITATDMNSNLEINKKYGPINSVSLALKDVEGENVTRIDQASITKNGKTMITIFDNPFVYSEQLREAAIDQLFQALKGFTYIPTKFNYKARLYMDCGDTIEVENVQTKTTVSSLILNQHIKIPATRQSSLENLALSDTEIQNEYISQSKQANTHTELMVNKQEKKIQGIISDIGDRTGKTTSITADIDGLAASVEQISVLTKTVDGIGKVELDNTSLTEVQEFKITGNIKINTLTDDEIGTYGTVPMADLAPMSTLAPIKPNKKKEALYFSDNTYLLDMTLIHIKSDKTIEKIILPDFELRTLADIKDEFIISNGVASVIQRIGIDDAGFIYVLNKPITTNLGEIHLTLTEGEETFYLEGFPNAEFSATYMTKNDLVESFATKVELKSSLELTSQTFNVELSKKVDDKELTGANIALRLNEDDSEATIKADKISLEGTVTANKNFKVLEDGSIEAKNGSFSGDIYLADGSNIIGGKGLYSNLQFISSNQFEKIGYQADEMNERNLKQSIKIQCNIPENFTIEKAFITLFHRPMALGNVNTIEAYGYARNIRLYTNENYEYSVSTEYYGSEFWEEEAYYLQEISGAFGSNGYTPSVPSASSLKLETKTTTDISGHLKTGLNEFVIQTANSIPSYIDGGLDLGYPNWLNVMKQTGGARAILFVYGYMKVK